MAKNIQSNPASSRKKEQAEFSKFDLPVLIYMLKGITSSDNSLSAAVLSQELKGVLGDSYSGKTLKRHLERIEEIETWEQEQDQVIRDQKRKLAEIMYCVYGGRIMIANAPSVRSGGTGDGSVNRQKRYYFEPCLDDSSMRMLNASVLSNHFLSDDERNYLLSRLRILNFLDSSDYLLEETQSPEKVHFQDDSDDTGFPGESNLYLMNITKLDYALRNEMQIEITYGTYDVHNGYIDYHKRLSHEGEVKKYRLNPYALFWNGGYYYLLATYVKGYAPDYVKEEGTPINFRSDRIIDISFVTNENGKRGERSYTSREKLPSRLRSYFYVGAEGLPYLNVQKYCSEFPMMRISQYTDLIEATIECTAWSLQIIADTFGNMVRVYPSSKAHSNDELDYNARPQTFLEAHIDKVEFENIRDFCLMHPEYITPLGPEKLVEAVREKLEAALKKLQ